MSNEKIVLDLDEDLSEEQSTLIPGFFREKLEGVIIGDLSEIKSISLEDDNDTMILVGRNGNALCRVITMTVLEDEQEIIYNRMKALVGGDFARRDIDLISVYNIAYRNGEEEPFIYYKDKETGEEKPIYGFCYKTVTVAKEDKHYAINLFSFIPDYSPENNCSVVRTKGKIAHMETTTISNIMEIGNEEVEMVNAMWGFLEPESLKTFSITVMYTK